MTLVQQIMHALGVDDSNDRLSRLATTARQSGTRNWRTARRYGRRHLRAVRHTSADALESIPPLYLWLGVAVVGAFVATAIARDRIPMMRMGRRVRDVMVKHVVTVDASATLQEAAQKMRESNVGVLPVVEGGRLRGIITDRDLVVRGLARGMDATTTQVRHIATEDLASARPDWDVEDALEVMSGCQVGRLPVVDDDDRVIGIVTLSSLALRSREHRETLDTAREVSRRSARYA
jgi:predicted transcriptional regulator